MKYWTNELWLARAFGNGTLYDIYRMREVKHFTIRRIAKETGYPPSAIRFILKRMNIT